MSPTVSSVKLNLARSRLCALAGVERSRHGRWISRGLLQRRSAYTVRDAVLAGALDQLRTAVGLDCAERVWPFAREELTLDGAAEFVVVDVHTELWSVARSDAELGVAVKRGGHFAVVDVGRRTRTIAERVTAFAKPTPE